MKVQAALYADGSACGNPEDIKKLLVRRKSRLETTRELIHRIDEAQSNGTPAPGIVDGLKHWSASLEAVDQATARAVIAQAIGDLEQKSIKDALGSLKRTEQAIAASKPPLP